MTPRRLSFQARPGTPLARSIGLLAAGLLLCACAASAQWRAEGVARVVAVSDVHGAHDAFVRTLQAGHLLDAEKNWIGGAAHLVVTGDLLDRGPDSRAAMDLLMRLETAAADAGGAVHVLLGNHEVMNLVGDLRYVSAAEYQAFAADEDAQQREHWFGAFLRRAGDDADPATLREQFDRQYPRGFFAHRRAFRPDGKYGAWLIQKPLIAVINDTAFVHGGLSPLVGKLGLDGVNDGLLQGLAEYLQAMAVLTDNDVLQPGDRFYNFERILEALPPDVERSADVEAAIATLERLNDSPIHDPDGPLWYRGSVACGPLVETARLMPVLQAIKARRVVIGHTPTVTRGVLSRLDGRVIEIDTGMLHAYYKGSGHALIIENGELSVINEQGKAESIAVDPFMNGAGPLSTESLQALLSEGEMTPGDQRADGGLAVSVQSGEQRVDAVFYRATSKKVSPELAAFRLDRLLGLHLVPVTVAREFGGRAGTLQFLPANPSDEAERAAAGSGAGAWCPLQAQWAAMYVFDTLIYKPARTPQQMMYDAATWQMFLGGHADAFGTGRGRPPYLKNADVIVDAAWREALAALDEERLQRELGEWLDRGRLRALNRRREAMLAP
jgi:hypothetical protein